MFTDRYGNELQATTGYKDIAIGTDKARISWLRQGNVVTYTLDGTLSSSSGNRYVFNGILPFKHPMSYGVISSFVAQTDLKNYGDMQIFEKKCNTLLADIQCSIDYPCNDNRCSSRLVAILCN